MQPQQQQEMTPQQFSQNMGQLKRRISQTSGETQQMTADVMSQTLDQIMQMSNQVFNQMAVQNQEITKVNAKLEKCYTAHPELKVTLESDEKEAASKAKKGIARKV
jgi:hypothetical protein